MSEKEFVEVKKIVNKVQTFVEKKKHAFVLPEHLLNVLMEDVKVNKFLKTISCDKNNILKDLDEFFKTSETTDDLSKIVTTQSYTSTIQRAIMLAGMRAKEPDSLYLLCSLYGEKESYATYFLMKNGVNEESVLDYIQKRSESQTTYLEKYAVNLVDMARLNNIGRIIGREEETDRMIQILNKKKSNNCIICGVSGVGKSAVVEGLAKRIAEDNVPDSIKGFDVWALDMGAMIAGTKFRGEFEERIQKVVEEVSKNKSCFLFIDEIHNVVGAGVGQDGALDASNILKPYLSRGELRVIGATTYDEYKSKILKDKAFARRFKKIDLNEPSKEDTVEILKGIRKEYEEYHNVIYSDEILNYIVDLSSRFVIDRYFPDKAIDILDEIGSQFRSGLKTGSEVHKEDVEEIVCKIANIKEITTSDVEKDKLKSLSVNIKKELYGQDETVDKIVKKIKLVKAGLFNRGKTLSFLLNGPTGTGKTEFVKRLAENLGMSFVKLDMSEYSLEMDVNKLTGCAQGFVGFEQSGALTEPLIRQPNTIVLLDEIEKAHKNVFNLLLQVMDEGKLTDNNGREANFKNAILFMTSNVGISQSEQTSASVGFFKDDTSKKKEEMIEKTMKKVFSPEFRNRIEEICVFNELDSESIKNIVYKNIRRINNDLLEKNVTVELKDSAANQIVELSMKEKLGGRPVERFVNKFVSEKIVDEILYGKLENGGNVTIDFIEDFVYNFTTV